MPDTGACSKQSWEIDSQSCDSSCAFLSRLSFLPGVEMHLPIGGGIFTSCFSHPLQRDVEQNSLDCLDVHIAKLSVCAVGVPVHWDFLSLFPPSFLLFLLRLKHSLAAFPTHLLFFHLGSSKNSGWCGPGDPATEKPRRGGK